MESNRLAAKKSRTKRKDYVTVLEQRLAGLERHAHSLETELRARCGGSLPPSCAAPSLPPLGPSPFAPSP